LSLLGTFTFAVTAQQPKATSKPLAKGTDAPSMTAAKIDQVPAHLTTSAIAPSAIAPADSSVPLALTPSAGPGPASDLPAQGGIAGTCVTCTPNEGEPLCGPDYVDATNGGCNSTPPSFTNIACGQTVCGESGNYVVGGVNNYRDTDWWLFTLTQPQVVTWTVTAEFPVLIGFVAQPCPQTAFIASVVNATACTPTTLSSGICLQPGQYVAFVAPSVFTGVTCGERYTGTLTCAACPGPCVTCTPNEGEPLCGPEYVDATNGGCNSTPPVFTNISCGQTVCGTGGTYTFTGANRRDTDWWLFTLTQPTAVTWTVQADFPVLIGFVAQPCPQAAFIAGTAVTGAQCATVTSTTPILAPGQYVAFVAPSVFTGVTCGARYTGTLSCGGDCPGDTDGDSDVDADDLTNVILQWGTTCPCSADVDNDNDVDSDDLTVVILEWGTPC
jgi:hypothetical protein